MRRRPPRCAGVEVVVALIFFAISRHAQPLPPEVPPIEVLAAREVPIKFRRAAVETYCQMQNHDGGDVIEDVGSAGAVLLCFRSYSIEGTLVAMDHPLSAALVIQVQ